ncbi:MAG: hypothetical protein GWO26_24080, partial [Phycisphaerae bacterium]|nr:hypothetical protein [Phycisphaerae bacterium]
MENVRAAWIWAIDHGKFSLISRAVRSYCWLFETTGLLTEGIEQFDLLVSNLRLRKQNSEEEKVLGQALAQQSLLYFRKGLFDHAQK